MYPARTLSRMPVSPLDSRVWGPHLSAGSLPPTQPWLHSSAFVSGVPRALPTQDTLTVCSPPHWAPFPALLHPAHTPGSASPETRTQPQPRPRGPRTGSGHLPARPPRSSPPRLRPAPWPPGGYQPVPPAGRRRSAANRRLPHSGPSRARGVGISGFRSA